MILIVYFLPNEIVPALRAWWPERPDAPVDARADSRLEAPAVDEPAPVEAQP